MTLTKDLTAKFAVAIVAVAMVFSAFVSAAKAEETTADLQAMINDLLAQVAALQAQAGQGGQSVASGICPYTWTRDLNVGATGADVMKLQQSLNADADTRVAAEGAGSVGMETETYGPATAAAVSKFQVKYRADILSPANLVNPTGYFGPSSRAKMNGICTSAPVVDTDDDATTDDSDDTDSADLSGEASLDNAEIDDADDSQLEEGAEDAAIAELTVEFADGDAEISRLDVTLDGDADVWDVLETVSLWVDGDKVAEMDANDEDEYLDTTGSEGTLRFSGLDIVAMEDEEVVITVAATINGSIDTLDMGDFTVSVDNMRYFDADGVATTDDETGAFDTPDTADFSIDEAGFEDEIIVKSSTNDPEATTLIVENDAKSDWYNVFTFDLDTDDSTNDIELTTVKVTVVVSSSTYEALVNDAELVIDGVTIDDVEVTGGATATATLTFNVDGDVTIDAGDRVAAELKLRFESLAGGDEGTTITASIDADDTTVESEGADDLVGDQVSGSAESDSHTLRTSGLVPDAGSFEYEFDTQGTEDTTGIFTITFDVTAYESDLYVADDGITYTVEGATTTISDSYTLTSTGDEDIDGVFTVGEGETETFTLKVTMTVDETGDYRVNLGDLEYSTDEDGSPVTGTLEFLPTTDYRTGYENINAAA